MTNRGPATIDILGAVAVVDSSLEGVLPPLLEAEPLSFSAVDGAVAGHKSLQRFFRRDDSGRFEIPAGCVPRIVDALRAMQIEVDVRDRRQVLPRMIPCGDEARGDRPAWCSGLVDAVSRKHCGVIVAAAWSLRLQAVAEIHRHFSQARSLIPFATVGACRAFADGLERLLPEQVGIARGGTWHSDKRIVCCTLRSFECCDPADWDIVVFPEADNALTRASCRARGAFSQQFVLAFVGAPRCQSNYERLLLEALAGPVIFQLGLSECRRLPVDAFGLLSTLTSMPSPSDPFERKRMYYWQNSARNSMIADVARGLADGAPESLWRHGLFVEASGPANGNVEGRRVAILVESKAHADRLGELLPEWRTMHAAHVELQSAGETSSPLNRVILTFVRADRMSSIDVDALVVACGGRPPVLPRAFPPPCNAGIGRRIMLVDLIDDFDEFGRAASLARFRAYRDDGFHLRGAAVRFAHDEQARRA
jgi:hypothetical protein